MDLEAPPTSIHDGRSFDFSMQNVNCYYYYFFLLNTRLYDTHK